MSTAWATLPDLQAKIDAAADNATITLDSNTEIAATLQVSRSPVREALRQIVSDGLADEIPNKGVFVRRLTARDVDELCELRVLIEGYAIRTGYDTACQL